jgi:phospholipase/lecithinase/hemolysin
VKPLLAGFVNCDGSLTPALLKAGQEALATYARVEGFALGPVFLAGGAQSVASVLTALTETVRREGAAAVAVPTAADLGRTPRQQQAMREQIRRTVGVPVHIVRPS